MAIVAALNNVDSISWRAVSGWAGHNQFSRVSTITFFDSAVRGDRLSSVKSLSLCVIEPSIAVSRLWHLALTPHSLESSHDNGQR